MKTKPIAVPNIKTVSEKLAAKSDRDARAWVVKFTAELKAQTGLSITEAGYSEAELLDLGYTNADPAAVIAKLVGSGKAFYIQNQNASSVFGRAVRNAF